MSTAPLTPLTLGLTPWDFSSVSASSPSAQALFAQALGFQPCGLTTAPQVDDWAIVGDSAYVRDKISEYRAAVGMSKLIVTRLRVEGVEEAVLRDSIARVAQLIVAP